MINIFFDCEFTKLQLPLDPEPNELISIGCVSDDGRKFYAENATTLARPEIFSEFVRDNVIPLLDGGDVVMSYENIAKLLKIYIESFGVNGDEKNVKMWSDAPHFDWQHVKHMLDTYGWPKNLIQQPVTLSFESSIQNTRFQNAVENAFNTFKPALRRHHALDDAIANRYGFQRATERRF
jgi:hypothetical protein